MGGAHSGPADARRIQALRRHCFDNDHPALVTDWTALPSIDCRNYHVLGNGLVGCWRLWRRGSAEQHSAEMHFRLPLPVRQESIVANAYKARREHVQQKPAN